MSRPWECCSCITEASLLETYDTAGSTQEVTLLPWIVSSSASPVAESPFGCHSCCIVNAR